MQVFNDWATLLRRQGRLTLQVPTFSIGFGAVDPSLWSEAPDGWFCELKAANQPVVGKAVGFLYISRAGYEANREEILAAFCAGRPSRGYSEGNAFWREQFEEYVVEHFASVQQQHQRLLARTQAEVEVRRLQDRLTPYWEAKLQELEAFPL